MAKFSELLTSIVSNFSGANIDVNQIIDQAGGDTDLGDINIDPITSAIGSAHRDQLSGIMKTKNAELARTKDEAYKAAERKIRSDVEASIVNKFGFTDEFENLNDLIDKVHTTFKPAGDQKPDVDVKQIELRHKQELKALRDQAEQQLNELRGSFEREKTIGQVHTTALSVLDSLNPNYTGNTTVDSNIKSTFLKELAGFDYKRTENGYAVFKGDEPVTDESGNALELDDHIKRVASNFFTFKAAEERKSPNGSAGSGAPQGQGGRNGLSKYQGKLPETIEELNALKVDRTIPLDQRQELQEWGRSKFGSQP